MSIEQWTDSIDGVDDIELGLRRTSPLIYHCAGPESGKSKGLVFLIPGFDDDIDSGGLASLRHALASEYDLLCVSVEYHCYRSRLNDGARFDISDVEFDAMKQLCQGHLVPLLGKQALIPALKALPAAYELELRVVPANGDYQNFGVMQALDHLAVLHDLSGSHRVAFDRRNVIAIGAGHGGYLAGLVAKLAPNALRGVLGCDFRTRTPLGHLFGESFGSEPPYYYYIGKSRVFPIITTKWSPDVSAVDGFSAARAEIRDIVLPSHLATMRLACRRPSGIRMAVTPRCSETVAAEISRAAVTMGREGIDCTIRHLNDSVANENDGAAGWLGSLFREAYESLPALEARSVADLSSSVGYYSGDSLYSFDFDDHGCQFSVVPMGARHPRISYF